MAKTKTIQKKNIRNVPPHIKGAIVQYAIDRGMTNADLVVDILEGHFAGVRQVVVFDEPPAPALGDQIHIAISATLAGKIWRLSRKLGETESSVVLGIIAEFFALDYEPVRRGARARVRVESDAAA